MRRWAVALVGPCLLICWGCPKQDPRPPVGRGLPPKRAKKEIIRQPTVPVPKLMQAVQSGSPILQEKAIRKLGRWGSAAAGAVALLTKTLGHKSAVVREESATALGRIGAASAPAVPQLIGALTDRNEEVRGEAARALARIFGKLPPPRRAELARAAVPNLLKAMVDKQASVREGAAIALGYGATKSNGGVAALQKAKVGDKSAEVRSNAKDALARIGVSSP